MSDYLGPLQTRVLDADFRSFESVVYQRRKPPLSSEINLSNKIDTELTRQSVHNLFPSGWAYVGDIREGVSENDCFVGDVMTSSSLPRNTIKLIARNRGELGYNNIAWVNGWPILVQGVGDPVTPDENNLILPASLDPQGEMEPPSSGNRVNFVFLEVWRKLVLPTDGVVYKYGNIQYSGTNLANDLIDCSVNYETSLRVQIQYRIRVVEDVDIETYPEGFDPNMVAVQGPMATPNNSCTNAYFTRVPGDIGLWRAGAGDAVAQQLLGTVDGYTYAIPMFAIARRNKTAYHYSTHDNGSARNRADFLGGIASDRPDGLYNDIIVAGDILDLRHRVGVNEDYSELAKDAFNKLIKGKLRTKMTKLTPGEDRFGVVTTKPDILIGDSVRRVFSNAPIDQIETTVIKTIYDKTPNPGFPWLSHDQVILTCPSGFTITSIDLIYAKGRSNPTFNHSTLPASSVVLALQSSMTPLYSGPMRIKHTIQSIAGNGLSAVPEKFLEFRQNPSGKSIASKDMDIPVRDSSSIGTTDGTFYNTLMNRGYNSTEIYDFGHQMQYHALGNGSNIISFKRDISGYNILGLASAKLNASPLAINTLTRTSTDYTVNFSPTVLPTGKNIELSLYTGTRFFDTNKQARAVIDSFEMAEITADQTGNGVRTSFTIDSTNRDIKSIATYITESSAYAYVDGSMRPLNTSNKSFDASTLAIIDFVTAPTAGSHIYVPVLMKSPIPSGESYICYYESVPYQGILDSSTVGYVAAEGPAIITTAGSGAITDYTSFDSANYADFTQDTTTVVCGQSPYSTGPRLLSNTKAGYLIHSNSEGRDYVISEVVSDTVLHLKNVSRTTATTSFSIIAKDQPYFNQRNIFDRLPMYDATTMDSSGQSYPIATAVADPAPVLETRIISRVQDITKNATIGINDVAPDGRGRSTIHMPADEASLGNGNLGLKFETLTASGSGAQKVYQAYAMDKDSSGHLCLMVVGSESPQTSVTYLNEWSDRDVVDLFELPGRPIINPNR